MFCEPSVLGSLLAGWLGWDLLVWLTEPFLAGGVAEVALDWLLVILGVWECCLGSVAGGLLTDCWWITDLLLVDC